MTTRSAMSDVEHCSVPAVYERLLAIRDLLGELASEGVSYETIDPQVAYDIGKMFEDDRQLFRVMDETPGHFLVNGRPPEDKSHGGAGSYYDGQGREGWHRLMRQLRNHSDVFWAGFHGDPLPQAPTKMVEGENDIAARVVVIDPEPGEETLIQLGLIDRLRNFPTKQGDHYRIELTPASASILSALLAETVARVEASSGNQEEA